MMNAFFNSPYLLTMSNKIRPLNDFGPRLRWQIARTVNATVCRVFLTRRHMQKIIPSKAACMRLDVGMHNSRSIV